MKARSLFVLDQPMLLLSSQNVEQGFDEFMNIVVDDAAEVYVKEAKPRRELGERFNLTPLSTH